MATHGAGNQAEGRRSVFYWAAWAAIVAALVATLAYCNDLRGRADPPSGGSVNTPPAQTATPTATSPSASPATSVAPPKVSKLTITAEIEPTYKIGPNEAGSCPETHGWCITLSPKVISDAGQLKEGCYLWWNLYRAGIKEVFESDRMANCDGWILVGKQRDSVPTGRYRLEMRVETDSGMKGTGTFTFTASPEGS
jgi:hypothetical protein